MSDYTLITDYDVYLFKQGRHYRLYEKFGSHIVEMDGKVGTYFAVWAPNASNVYVMGSFNEWNPESHPLSPRPDGSGIWEGYISGVDEGTLYKYRIISKNRNYWADKSDPFAYYFEVPPKTASIVWSLDYEWKDDEWMKNRREYNSLDAPFSIYEVHLGSWRRVPEEDDRWLTYREMAHHLPKYVKEMGFTHVEFMPVMEHPFYGSWGYQITGYYAPTSRYGKPQDLMYLIDQLHQHGIGVILDWVPSHFPTDGYGLVYFDGTHLYEYEDWRKRYHPDWNSYIFDYGKNEVRSFLISNALFWLDKYHADGLRIDAVASMLYLDYSRREGEWVPNIYGGKENLEAISFLRDLNEAIYRYYPDVQVIAEESTAWPMVSKPTYVGGLGFGMKWNLGWMHDILNYLSKDPIYRKYHHNQLIFSIWYAFSENFILPLSHDEVVHGKGSLINKMPGDDWQKFANLRLLFGYMYAHPGKKLLFMGGEFGQWSEWNHDRSLDWHLLEYPKHQGLQRLVRDLNSIYRRERALHRSDFSPDGFEWIDFNDWEQSVISFIRRDRESDEVMLIVCNFTPVPRIGYRVGSPRKGFWRELLNTDSEYYGGSGLGNLGGVEAVRIPFHRRDYSITLTLPPLACLYFKSECSE
ncbi:MAG: 1,4-alpha-glucan branching protein GlgB [Nitrososphaerales archaeon]|nr:1,4-alpha-glucan branching protein GlgB [Nitrososphaerales archaeon]